jgi:nucleotide-binding universal stress UspA family protein
LGEVAVEITVERRVVVGVSPTLAGLQALRFATDQARQRAARLMAVRAFRASGTGVSLRAIARQAAIDDVYAAFDDAYGGPPHGIETVIVVREGVAGDVLVAEASRESDLLVVGGSGVRRLGSLRRAPTARRCARRTVCPLVIVPLPEYARSRSTGRLARAFADDVDRLLLPLDPGPAIE